MAGAIPDPPWWRERGDASRSARRALSRDAIVEAALALLERDGLAGLSMRRLADELGTGAASLYWHVRDKEELLSLLLDRIVGETRLDALDAGSWQATLKEMGRETRRLLLSRRDAAQLSLGRIPAGPASLPVMEHGLAVLAAAGLPPRVISHATDLLALYVGAFAYEESLRLPPLGEAAATPDQFADYLRSLPADRFPNLVALAGDLVAGDADERFEFGLEVLVRGLEAMVASA
jgi:AcrR family transcriptional regulator